MAENKNKPTKNLTEFKSRYSKALIDTEELASHHGFISTGSRTVDDLLCGGLPLGTMSEFGGPPHSGKTTLALSTAGAVQKAGGNVAWMDLEWALDIRKPAEYLAVLSDEDAVHTPNPSDASWLQKNGVDPFADSFTLIQPQDGEEMYEILEEIILGKYFQYVTIDSVAAITTRAELEGQMGESHYGQVAKLNSAALKRIMRRFGGNRETHVTFINQVRDKIGSRFGGKKSTGGHALAHFMGTKLYLQRLQKPTEDSSGEVTQKTKVEVTKSRYAPSKSTEIVISSIRGIDTTAELLAHALQEGYVHKSKSSSWFYIYDSPVNWKDLKKKGEEKNEEAGFVTTLQGEGSVKEFMDKHDWHAKLHSVQEG